jgi:hypothetical protein
MAYQVNTCASKYFPVEPNSLLIAHECGVRGQPSPVRSRVPNISLRIGLTVESDNKCMFASSGPIDKTPITLQR